jgi:D-alanyl-D-alanine carboxypeptidase (penicillin-binding protein 5/6)
MLTRRHVGLVAAVLVTGSLLAPAWAGTEPQPPGDGVVGGGSLGSALPVADAPGAPPLPRVSAASYVLADLESGTVLAAKNAHGRFAPASTLKILTAVALIPMLPADRVVTATYADAAVDGSKVGIVPSGSYRVGELMTAMMAVSGNDAANTLASAAGGPAVAVRALNDTAAALGAKDTLARNPHGLDAPGQVSSAYDLALLARAGLRMPDFRRYVAVRRSTFGAIGAKRFEIYTHNKLVLRYPGAVGVKNGFTASARASFVGAAERNGRRLVVALMRADPLVWKEAAALLDWGFAAGDRAGSVGHLVEPVEHQNATDGEGTATALGTSVLRKTTPGSSGGSFPTGPAVAAGGVMLGFLTLRWRASRASRRPRLRLPPL